jgi:phage gp46-like protein
MDIALKWDPQKWEADIVLAGADLLGDDTLETSIIISLFADRRAQPDDVLPNEDPNHPGGGDRRGWWADWYSPDMLARQQAIPGTVSPPAQRIGSRLWLLARSKQLPKVVSAAQQYGQEALQWLVDSGIASSLTVTAAVVRPGVLGLGVQIARNRAAPQRYDFIWGAA